jgi:nucleotide-binding universal stress UspA family protein
MNILVAYDGSIHADTAIDDLQWAGLPGKAHVTVLSAVEWTTVQAVRGWGIAGTDFSPDWTERIAAAEQLAEAGSNRLQKQFPQWDIELEASAEHPATAILDKARSWPADLLVVGTHGRSALGRVVMGSVSSKLVRDASCSVRVARLGKHDGPIRLLVGTDGSPEALAAGNEVCRRSWPAGTEARLIAVHEPMVPANAERIAIGDRLYQKINEDEQFRLQRVVHDTSELLRQAGLVVYTAVAEGNPKQTLTREAEEWKADTIFIGARGLGRTAHLLLGSVSSATVAHAPCTVEVVRQR